MYTIAVVEDDIHIGNLLKEALETEGYKVLRAFSGTEAALLLERKSPDLILLDLMLPGLSGEDLLPALRGIPVIVLSARTDVEDRVKLLDAGAADYLTKPFDIRELMARIRIQLRNGAPGNPRKLRSGNLCLDLQAQLLTLDDTPLHLTPTEFAILKLLMQNPGQVISKTALLDRISLDVPDCTESSLKVHISNLRKKLKTVSPHDYIESAWGIGFLLRP